MIGLFKGIYKGKTVLVTGHTGFKGTWLVYWLNKMGANVIGYSLNEITSPSHFSLLKPTINSIFGDIRDTNRLNKVFKENKPDIVFHLAAQTIVRQSYMIPIETYETNVMGTLNVFEAARNANTKVIINITSDKAYENKEWQWGYRENDTLGGYDPYSSSKACSEILTNSYRNSYFNLSLYKKSHQTLLASCRAGNVIGGGDWTKDRLMTDIVLSASKNKITYIRNPNAIRPWQHVLEALSAYLQLGEKLLNGNIRFSGAWNIGPSDNNGLTVENILLSAQNTWKEINFVAEQSKNQLHEANNLKLDCSKANSMLKWESVWEQKKAIYQTINWYKEYYESNKILTSLQLDEYIESAKNKTIEWAT